MDIKKLLKLLKNIKKEDIILSNHFNLRNKDRLGNIDKDTIRKIFKDNKVIHFEEQFTIGKNQDKKYCFGFEYKDNYDLYIILKLNNNNKIQLITTYLTNIERRGKK